MNRAPEQEQVIWARNWNLLVSAAAGSDKTAVLVERIIQMMTDKTNPVDIDESLVMTFTKAVAAEIRERAKQAVGRKLAEQPDNEHLQLQSTPVHHAQITTIDNFCLNLIRDHFNVLEINPGFRIGGEGELILLRKDVMERLPEDYYEKGDERFEQFVDTYAAGKADGGIEDYIMQACNFAQNNPWPMMQTENCRKELRELEEGHLEETAWMKLLMEDVRKQLGELCEQLGNAIGICQEEGGPEVYLPTLETELAMLEGLRDAGTYEELCQSLRDVSFGRLAATRNKEIDGEKKAFVTGCRDRIKKAVAGLEENYGFENIGGAVSDMIGTGDVVEILLELACESIARYQENKRGKNVVDFNDLEHYALDVLVKQEDRKVCYTDTTNELSAQYREILVNEYQDNNYVQEELINSLSGTRFGRPNVFMVGDVKQSTYHFRLARPELFMEKYETYTVEDSSCQKIELHQNLRNRASVLESVNQVLYSIMTKNLGNIQYTEDVALRSGAVFEPVEQSAAGAGTVEAAGTMEDGVVSSQAVTMEDGTVSSQVSAMEASAASDQPAMAETGIAVGQAGTPTELLLVNTGKRSDQAEGENASRMSQAEKDEMVDYTNKEVEAKLIARRIRELADEETGLLVWDKEGKRYHMARYRDMVVLLRSISGWTDSFLNVLTQEGIPACADTGTGYFNTIEVETVLFILAAIDSPMQDILLAAVFKSPVAGITDEELVYMMALYRKNPDRGQECGLYDAWKYCTKLDVPTLSGKLHAITDFLTEMRDEATYLPIHEITYRVFMKTGYYDYVSAMPAGEIRRINPDMLVEGAAAYEKTSYKGLLHLIRYINNLKKHDTDFGETSIPRNGENIVRLMSIHKSRGLEFPIVFLAGLGKSFDKQDVRGKTLIDAGLGAGTDYLSLDLHLKSTTLRKNVLKRKMDLDSLGKELRVLYVAITRTKERLIMTGTDRYLDKKQEKQSQTPWEQTSIPYTVLASAGPYLDWLLVSLLKSGKSIITREIPLGELVGEEVIRQVKKRISKEELLQMDVTAPGNRECPDTLQSILAFRYPYEADVTLHTKMSVPELKKLGQDADDWNSLYQPIVPELLREDTPTSHRVSKTGQNYGASRGTAYHRTLELLDFTTTAARADVTIALQSILDNRKTEEQDWKMLDSDVIWQFLTSPLGRRMRAAQEKGLCHRKQQLVMGIPAAEIGFANSEELVLVQGIIDAYLEEEQGLILIDYKTDKVSPGQEDYLVKRYKGQFDYYQRVLEQMTGKLVAERLIYSITLQKETVL